MNFLAILAIVEKGMTVISALIAAGQEAGPAIKVITNLVTGAKAGTVTDDELNTTEASLDSMIDDFNLDIPEA